MRIKTIIFTLLYAISTAVHAQSSDQKLAEMINSGDWFALNESYPFIKDSVETPYLRLIAEIMLDNVFNKTDSAIDKIDMLLKDHQGTFPAQTAMSFAVLRCQLQEKQGRYSDAADGIKNIIDKLASANVEVPEMLWALYSRYNSMKKFAPITVERMDENIEVGFSLLEPKSKKREAWMKSGRKSFHGYFMQIPVQIHGKTKLFILDTGADKTFIRESVAKELGISVMNDTITLNETAKGRLGYIDALEVGRIKVKNLLPYVGLSDDSELVMGNIDAVLGIDFLNAVGEVQILFEENKIVFPGCISKEPELERSIYVEGVPVMKALRNGQRILFNLDTGCTTAELYEGYYQMFKEEVDLTATKDTITTATVGSVANHEVLMLPQVDFLFCGNKAVLEEVYVYPQNEGWLSKYEGRMGMDLIRRFRKTTLNFRDMFVKFE